MQRTDVIALWPRRYIDQTKYWVILAACPGNMWRHALNLVSYERSWSVFDVGGTHWRHSTETWPVSVRIGTCVSMEQQRDVQLWLQSAGGGGVSSALAISPVPATILEDIRASILGNWRDVASSVRPSAEHWAECWCSLVNEPGTHNFSGIVPWGHWHARGAPRFRDMSKARTATRHVVSRIVRRGV